jgi:DNA topoisomerase-3
MKGFISYPHTETNRFDKAMDFHSLIEKQVADPGWGEFAARY